MIVEALRQLVPEKHLRKRDSRTTDLRVEQRSLEDVFLDVTGKELRS